MRPEREEMTKQLFPFPQPSSAPTTPPDSQPPYTFGLGPREVKNPPTMRET